MQTTVGEQFSVEGIGVHTGKNAKLIVKPAPVDTGIIFKRDGVSIQANIENVNHTEYGVTLKFHNKEVKTCEHILSALYGLGVDNAICEIEGEEVPVLDGSSLPFIKLIKVKSVASSSDAHMLEIKEPVFVQSKLASIFAVPSEEFKITFLIDYQHPGIKTQCNTFIITPDIYQNEIAPARTYTFANWVDRLQSEGLVRGGSLDNAVVIGEDGPLNDLRLPDEQVRHKILDLIGDLALLNARLKGWVIAIKSGHTLNIELVKKLKYSFKI